MCGSPVIGNAKMSQSELAVLQFSINEALQQPLRTLLTDRLDDPVGLALRQMRRRIVLHMHPEDNCPQPLQVVIGERGKVHGTLPSKSSSNRKKRERRPIAC